MPENNTKSQESVRKKGISAFYSAVFFSKEFSGMPPRISRFFSNARIFKLFSSVAHAVAYTSTRTFGCTFASFGLLSLILHLAKYYFAQSAAVEMTALVIGAIFAIISIPLLLMDGPICIALQDFRLTDFILFEFFSIKRMRRDESVRTLHPIFGVIMGVIPAVIGYFLPPVWVALAIAGLVFVSVAFVSPEFPFLFTLMAMPYISLIPYSHIILSALVLLTLLSFFRKVLFGKRVYVFGISDAMIILFVLVLAVTGSIGGTGASVELSLTLAALSLCYIPAANMIVNRRLADCAVNAVIVSAIPCAVYAIVMYVISWVKGERAPQDAFMLSPDALALLFAVAFAFVLFVIRDAKHTPTKPLYVCIAMLLALAIFATECVPVLIILLVGLPAYSITVSKKVPKDTLVLLAALPVVVLLLPVNWLEAISAFFGMQPTFVQMKNGAAEAVRCFGANLLFGIGGDGAKEAQTIALFSSYSGLACRFGVFALLLIFLVVLARNRQTSVYRRFLKSSSALPLSRMTTLSIFVFMAFGWFFDVTANPEAYCLFFAIFGMSTAALRLSKREYDDRHGYFDDQESSDSYVTNVILR